MPSFSTMCLLVILDLSKSKEGGSVWKQLFQETEFKGLYRFYRKQKQSICVLQLFSTWSSFIAFTFFMTASRKCECTFLRANEIIYSGYELHEVSDLAEVAH